MIYPFLDEHVDADIGIEDRDGVEIYEHDIVGGGACLTQQIRNYTLLFIAYRIVVLF